MGRREARRWRLALVMLAAAGLACSVVQPRAPTATPFPTVPLTALPLTPVAPLPSEAAATVTGAVPPATSAPPSLTPSVAPTTGLAGQIAFTCFIDGFDNLCLINADGTNLRRLTETAATDFYPSLSPDGRQIVFSSRREGNFDIYVLDIATKDVRKLTSGLGSNFGPEFSPDGTRIVFASSHDNIGQIWVMDADGANPRQLAAPGSCVDPTWSPDGQSIAFACLRGGTTELYLMAADGSAEQPVTGGLNVGGRSDWSPDGRLLTFYAGEPNGRNIYTIDLATHDVRQLTSEGDNRGPSFSPDGQWIAFAGFRDGDNEIYAVRTDGSALVKLTDNTRPDWQPRWGASSSVSFLPPSNAER
jgi:Tol biopolymer transport system component